MANPDDFRVQTPPQQPDSRHAPLRAPYPVVSAEGPPAYRNVVQPPYVGGPQRGTNGTAIAALVLALLFAPLGIILGHIALAQIKRSGEGGAGLAKAALIIGYILVLPALIALLVLAVVVVVNGQDGKDRKAPPPTVTNTITETTPFQSPTAMPGWTDDGPIGNGGQQNGLTRLDAMAPEQIWK